ncbi:hypothetical protein Tco_0688802 [Tanacetum coccineum]
MSYGIMCNLCNDDILHDPTTIRQHVVTFHLDALPTAAAAAAPPPPPPVVDDHDDSYGLGYKVVMNKKWHVCFKEVKGFKGYWKTSGKVKDVYVRKDGKVSNVVEEQKKASDDGVILNEKMVSETVQETNVNLIVFMNVEGLKMVKGNLYKAGYEVKD